MKKILSFSVTFLTLQAMAQQPPPKVIMAAPITLTTNAFADGGIIPVKFSQAAPNAVPGGGTSPELKWTNVPEGTRSFVIHMHDMDVARNKTTEDQAHWVVWNIPPTTTFLPEGMPAGAQLADGSYQMSATGTLYRGPGAPATGPLHHYVIEIYALDMVPDVKPGTDAFETRKRLFAAIEGHILGKGMYTGLFKRPQ